MKLLLAAVALAALMHQGTTLKCYRCCNNPALCTRGPIDPECGNPDYSNLDYQFELGLWNYCIIMVWTDGYDEGTVFRDAHFGSRNSNDEDCSVNNGVVTCKCYDDSCNTNLCEHCL
ncbi:unnamed protein product, partial [Meganyctiphanes norvegica]